MMAGLSYAREVETPLNTHLTIHWGGTMAGDDPEGKIFTQFRNLFHKRLKNRKVRGGLKAIWAREHHRNEYTNELSDVDHCHMLFHLLTKYMQHPYRDEIITVIEELVDLVGNGNYDDRTVKLTFPRFPDGKYLLKGGTPKVWELYRIPEKWRSYCGEGLIEGKRCGTTQNIGPAARERHAHHQMEARG